MDVFRHIPDLRRPVDCLEPGTLPEYQAASLTSAVNKAIAAEVEMIAVLQASPSIMPAYCIAGLGRGLVNAKALSAVFEHLRHEGELLQAPVLVERSKNFLFAQ